MPVAIVTSMSKRPMIWNTERRAGEDLKLIGYGRSYNRCTGREDVPSALIVPTMPKAVNVF